MKSFLAYFYKVFVGGDSIDPFISYFDLATSSNLATANISQYFGNDLSTVTDAYEEADDQIEPPSEISMNSSSES